MHMFKLEVDDFCLQQDKTGLGWRSLYHCVEGMRRACWLGKGPGSGLLTEQARKRTC